MYSNQDLIELVDILRANSTVQRLAAVLPQPQPRVCAEQV